MTKFSECKGCGREIVFARNMDSTALVPLELAKHLYREIAGEVEGDMMVEKIKDEEIYLSHFLTCKTPQRFSSSKKKVEESNPFLNDPPLEEESRSKTQPDEKFGPEFEEGS